MKSIFELNDPMRSRINSCRLPQSARLRWRIVLAIGLLVALASSSGTLQAAPAIFNQSVSANPGDVIFLQGDSFGNTPGVRANANGGPWQALSVVSSWVPAASGPAYITVQIPSNFPNGIYDLQVFDGSNWSTSAIVNQPLPNDLEMEKVIPGQTMRVFGRNLTVAGGTASATFYNPANGTYSAATINSASSDAYQLSVTAPSGLVPGVSYTVYVNNGYAPSYGMAVPETVTANAGTDVWGLGVGWGGDFSATFGNVVIVPAPLGNNVDDAPNINAAIKTAVAQGGGVVQLQPGTYNLSSNVGIGMYSNIVLNGSTGAGGTTTINYGSATPNGYYSWIIYFYPNQSKMGLANLTLTDVDNRATNNWISTLLNSSGNSEIFFKNVTFNLGLSQGPNLAGITDFLMKNSEITQGVTPVYGAPLSIGSSYSTFKNNILSWDESYFVFGSSSSTNAHMLIENNTFNLNAGWTAGWTGSLPHFGTLDMVRTNDTKIIGNTFALRNGPAPFCTCGETILDENGGASDHGAGTVTSATATTLSDAANTFSPSSSANVVITSGTGMGQWRAVSSASGNTLTVSQPWTIVPDSTSRYTILDWSAANWLVEGNTLTGQSFGIALYASASHDLTVVGNTLRDSGGILLRGDQRTVLTPPAFRVIWDAQILGNSVIDDGANSPQPAFIRILDEQSSKTQTWGPGALGIEVRNNYVVGSGGSNASEGMFIGGFLENGALPYAEEHIPLVLGSVLQNNSVEGTPTAYSVNTGSYASVIWDHTENFDGAFLSDTTLPTTTHASVNTMTHGSQVIQAEAGTVGGSAYIRAGVPAAVGSSEVAMPGVVGSYNQVTGLDGGATGGTFPLTIRYGQGNTGTSTTSLYVNGVFSQSVAFPPTPSPAGTPSWNVCANVTVNIPLNAGPNNTIKLQVDGLSGAVNVDQYSLAN